jgi:hypothetical protein
VKASHQQCRPCVTLASFKIASKSSEDSKLNVSDDWRTRGRGWKRKPERSKTWSRGSRPADSRVVPLPRHRHRQLQLPRHYQQLHPLPTLRNLDHLGLLRPQINPSSSTCHCEQSSSATSTDDEGLMWRSLLVVSVRPSPNLLLSS